MDEAAEGIADRKETLVLAFSVEAALDTHRELPAMKKIQEVDLRINIVNLGHVEVECVGDTDVVKHCDDVVNPAFEKLRAELLNRPPILKLKADRTGCRI